MLKDVYNYIERRRCTEQRQCKKDNTADNNSFARKRDHTVNESTEASERHSSPAVQVNRTSPWRTVKS